MGLYISKEMKLGFSELILIEYLMMKNVKYMILVESTVWK